ncbi:Dynein heavy chain 6 axonemal, partial [Biomphalaria glabrata]
MFIIHTNVLLSCFSLCTGAPQGKRVVIFIDDLNMPKLDTYGSQPPIELLRQYLDFDGLYDRETMTWKEIQ